MRAVVTGGGTGGHIYPALAVARGLSAAGYRVTYIGTAEGMEAGLVREAGLPFKSVEARKLARGKRGQLLPAIAALGRGIGQAGRLLKRLRPQVVVGTGGYVCAPVVLAASMAGLPTVIHEQNSMPGITNKLLSSYASAVCVTFPEAVRHFPPDSAIFDTGLPLREEVLTWTREDAAFRLGLSANKLTILAVGGSLGARRINEAMLAVHQRWREDPQVQIIHVTGESGYDMVLGELRERGIDPGKIGDITIIPYLHEMPAALALADVVIGRAGAAFISELTAKGLAAILIPYPYAAENHQEYNARSLLQAGACEMILDAQLTPAGLVQAVESLIRDQGRRRAMAAAALSLGRPDALERFLEVVRKQAN